MRLTASERIAALVGERGEFCKRGHYWLRFGRVDADGKVRCRECHRLASIRYKARRTAKRLALKGK